MKRMLVILAAALVLVMTAAPVAFAGPGKAKPGQGDKAGWKHRVKKKVFTANGVITAVDAGNSTFSMKVWSGGKMRGQRGKVVEIKVTDTTRIFRVVIGKRSAVALDDVLVGERAWVKGTFTKDADGAREYTAKRVRLKATWPFMVKGTVAALDPDGKTITVTVTRAMRAMRGYVGDEVVFQTLATTRYLKKVDRVVTTITFDDVRVDDTVVVNGRVDNTQPKDKQFIAKRVLVKG